MILVQGKKARNIDKPVHDMLDKIDRYKSILFRTYHSVFAALHEAVDGPDVDAVSRLVRLGCTRREHVMVLLVWVGIKFGCAEFRDNARVPDGLQVSNQSGRERCALKSQARRRSKIRKESAKYMRMGG